MTMTMVGCAVVAGLALAYAVEESRRLVSGRRFRHVGRGQAVRRVIGSLLVPVLMALVYEGLEGFDPFREPTRFLLVWLFAGVLVIVLLVLAWLDLRELSANRDLVELRQILRRDEASEPRNEEAPRR